MKALRAFTLIELIVVIAIIGLLSSIVMASLADTRKEALDKRRMEDLRQVKNALELYYTDHRVYPSETDGNNGNIATNATLRAALAPYIKTLPADPRGAGDATYYYYYDGAHTCGDTDYAYLFARQMALPANSNYQEHLENVCVGSLDGEGRGGGTESYNLRIGISGDYYEE
jgi:type II secretion system protein G